MDVFDKLAISVSYIGKWKQLGLCLKFHLQAKYGLNIKNSHFQ